MGDDVKLLISLMTILMGGFAQAGVDGGGGGAFVCNNQFGATEPAYSVFLDLWETDHIFKFAVPRSSEAVEVQIGRALEKLKTLEPIVGRLVETELSQIQSGARDLDPDVIINPPADAKAKYGKRGCTFEGMMYFDGTINSLLVDRNIFSMLETQTDIAAAWMHEAIYKVARDYFNHDDSIGSRRLVGCLFSTANNCILIKKTEDDLKTEPNTQFCQGPNVEFYRTSHEVKEGNETETVYDYGFTRINNLRYSVSPLFSRPSTFPSDHGNYPADEQVLNPLSQFRLARSIYVRERDVAGFPQLSILFGNDDYAIIGAKELPTISDLDYSCSPIN
jgi:hypothetical protein